MVKKWPKDTGGLRPALGTWPAINPTCPLAGTHLHLTARVEEVFRLGHMAPSLAQMRAAIAFPQLDRPVQQRTYRSFSVAYMSPEQDEG